MSDPMEIPGGRPPVLMTGREPPRPWRPPVAPPPLVPEAPRDAQSQAFEDNRRIAVRGLAGGTRLLESVAQGLVGGGLAGGATAGAAVRKVVTDEQRGLGAAERSWLEPLRALTESVAAPLEAQRRQAGLAEIVGALQAQKAVLAKLAGMGAPLPALEAAVRGQLDQLYGRGLMAGERAAVESAWLEELTAEKERGRQARETERQTAQQERLLGGLLSGAVSGVARGQAPDETQAAALEEAQPGLGAAAAEESQAWAARQDALLGLVARTPVLRRLRSLGGEGAEGLYRRLLVSEQRRAGVPEGELKVWNRAESDAAVAAWVGLAPSGAQPHERAAGLVGYARERLAGLPAALRPLAVAALRRRGLAAGDAAALTGIADALAAGRDIAAQGLADRWAAGEALPGAVQVADSGETKTTDEAARQASWARRGKLVSALLDAQDPKSLDRLARDIELAFADDPERQRSLLGAVAMQRRALSHGDDIGLAELGPAQDLLMAEEWRYQQLAWLQGQAESRGLALDVGDDGLVTLTNEAGVSMTLPLEVITGVPREEHEPELELWFGALGGSMARDEALALARRIEPTDLEERAELESLVSEYYDALDAGLNPAAAAVALRAGVFPPSKLGEFVEIVAGAAVGMALGIGGVRALAGAVPKLWSLFTSSSRAAGREMLRELRRIDKEEPKGGDDPTASTSFKELAEYLSEVVLQGSDPVRQIEPANAYAGGRPGLRGTPEAYEPQIQQWGSSSFEPKNPDVNKHLEPRGKSESRRGKPLREVRALNAQDEAARILQYAGFDVEITPDGGPDFLVDGIQYEHYLSISNSAEGVFRALKGKMDKNQGGNFVIQLHENSGPILEEIKIYLNRWGEQPSKNGHVLKHVVAIDAAGNIVVIWP